MEFIKEYWTQIVFLIGLFGGLWKWGTSLIEKITIQNKTTNRALLELIRHRLYKECDKCIATRMKSVRQLEIIKHLHDIYKEFGGNSIGDQLVKEAECQPTVDDEIFEQQLKVMHCKDFKHSLNFG